MRPIIYFASDHAGFALKNELIPFVKEELGYEVIDCGAFTHNEQDDFTDFISKAAAHVSAHPKESRAIILGGSGQGEAMLANGFPYVRAAVYYGGNIEIVKLSREHNDANVLSLGARFVNSVDAKEAVQVWLETDHSINEKYDRRIRKMDLYDAPLVSLQRSIAPSLPAQSFDEITQLSTKLQGVASSLQIDIVDGIFVPHTSWPFTEEDIEASLWKLASLTDSFEIEMDCMCMHPESYLDLFVTLGVRRMIVHLGTTQALAKCIAHAHEHRYSLGFAFTNDTNLEDLYTYIHEIDFVQVMGIAHVGVQGQPFDERTLATIARLRRDYPFLEIAVDGAVNKETITQLLAAGANRFAPGSAVSKALDPALAYKQLAELIGL